MSRQFEIDLSKREVLGEEVVLLISVAKSKGIDLFVWFGEDAGSKLITSEFNNKLTSLSLVVGVEEDQKTKRVLEIATSSKSLKQIKTICGVMDGSSIDVQKFLYLCQSGAERYNADRDYDMEHYSRLKSDILIPDSGFDDEFAYKAAVDSYVTDAKKWSGPTVSRPKSAPPGTKPDWMGNSHNSGAAVSGRYSRQDVDEEEEEEEFDHDDDDDENEIGHDGGAKENDYSNSQRFVHGRGGDQDGRESGSDSYDDDLSPVPVSLQNKPSPVSKSSPIVGKDRSSKTASPQNLELLDPAFSALYEKLQAQVSSAEFAPNVLSSGIQSTTTTTPPVTRPRPSSAPTRGAQRGSTASSLDRNKSDILNRSKESGASARVRASAGSTRRSPSNDKMASSSRQSLDTTSNRLWETDDPDRLSYLQREVENAIRTCVRQTELYHILQVGLGR